MFTEYFATDLQQAIDQFRESTPAELQDQVDTLIQISTDEPAYAEFDGQRYRSISWNLNGNVWYPE